MGNFPIRPEIEALKKERRARAIALAIIRRGRDAKIPEEFLRINKEGFRELLCEQYHDPNELSSSVYDNADNLLTKTFIVIDGGNFESRKKAGFALLFRIIACDKFGRYMDCKDLVHKLYSFQATEDQSRNDLTEELKSHDVLFISEFSRSLFKPHFESGEFLDEILDYRVNYSKPTIVSFSEPMKTFDDLAVAAAEGALNKDCGVYLSNLSYKEKQTDKIFRVKVKAI